MEVVRAPGCQVKVSSYSRHLTRSMLSYWHVVMSLHYDNMSHHPPPTACCNLHKARDLFSIITGGEVSSYL